MLLQKSSPPQNLPEKWRSRILRREKTESKLDFLKWKLLRVAGIRFTQSPDRLDIERVEVQHPV
jgi:hypothetical protein